MRGIRYSYTFEPSQPTFYPSVNDSVLVTVVLPPTPGFFRDTILIWSGDLRVNPFRVGTRLRILTGVEPASQQPETYQLHQNFPNPFNPVTLITYDLPKQSFVRLTISNVLGQEIRVLYEGVRMAGRYSAEFDAAGFSSGVYFYKLEANPMDSGGGGFRAVRKMLVVK